MWNNASNFSEEISKMLAGCKSRIQLRSRKRKEGSRAVGGENIHMVEEVCRLPQLCPDAFTNVR